MVSISKLIFSCLDFEEKNFVIRSNKNYPRINRLRYLAEHKLYTSKVSQKRIIDWFGENEPFSGYGKLMLGQSLISIGDFNNGIKLIKIMTKIERLKLAVETQDFYHNQCLPLEKQIDVLFNVTSSGTYWLSQIPNISQSYISLLTEIYQVFYEF